MSDAVCAEIDLDADPDRVWEIVMNPHRLGEWVTTHRGLGEGAPGELGEGSCFEQRLRVAAANFSVTWTIADCERPRSVSWNGRGPGGSTAEVRYRLDPLGETGTHFSYENRFELPGGPLGRLAGRAVGDRVARRETERTLQNLKALVERS